MSATATATDAKQEIREAMAAWSDALERRDLDALMAGYASDAVMFDVKPPYRIDGLGAIRAAWAGMFPCFPHEFASVYRDVTIHVDGDVAFAIGLHAFHSDTEPNHPMCRSWIRFTIGYRKVNGRWLSVHDHVSFPFDFAKNQLMQIADPDAR